MYQRQQARAIEKCQADSGKMMNFGLTMMNFGLKMMSCGFKMTNHHLLLQANCTKQNINK